MGRVKKYALVPHQTTLSQDLRLGCKMTLVGSDVLKIEYVVSGHVASLSLPPVALPDRKDGLWQHTCFEAFFAVGAAYIEFNFSPSRHFASYRFEAYRDGMQPALDLPAPDIYVEADEARYSLTSWVDLKHLGVNSVTSIGLSAVIEKIDGTKSYWALHHAPGPPDFHNSDCFIATLPAPNAA